MPETDQRDDQVKVPVAGRHLHRNMAIVGIALIAVAVLAWWWAHTGPTGGTNSRSAGGKGRPTTTVGIAQVQRFDMPLTVTTIGTAQPTVAATVRTQVAGVLRAIHFTEGQLVSRGQVLAQIDPSSAQQAVAQARGALQKDIAALNSARVDLTRYQTLWKQDSIAKQVMDSQAATMQQAQGTVAADRAAMRSAEVALGYTTIRAPVSGRLGLRQADLGSYVTPADPNGIVSITLDTPMDVNFAVPQTQLAQVARAARAPRELSVTVLDQTDGSVLAEGRFLTFDNAVDTTTGTIKGKARFDNLSGNLVPNQFVNVRLNVGILAGALTVPVSAVRHGSNGDFVFTLTADRKAHLVPVVVGPSDTTRTVIIRGLAGNESVITEGADKLDDGSPVALPGGRSGAGGSGGHGGRRHRASGASK